MLFMFAKFSCKKKKKSKIGPDNLPYQTTNEQPGIETGSYIRPHFLLQILILRSIVHNTF